MLELIFAIVILGIVASIGAEVITQTFESYIIQRAQYRANIKTELALNQIANRLRYAIPGTVGARKTLGDSYIPMEVVTDDEMRVLQWVGYDGDSFEAITAGSRRPGWSGFCDVDVSSSTAISTPGSNLDLASTIITNLKGTVGDARLYFAGDGNLSYGVASIAGETITMDGIPAGTLIPERYKLAWSSYALEVDANNDLRLHHHFNPTAGADIANDTSTLLLHDVTNFRFKYSGGAFRLKLCKEEQISDNAAQTLHACKEKVVF
jgi:hypothetical protein